MVFQVIKGGKRPRVNWFGTVIRCDSPALGVQVTLYEEDGFLVLSAPPEVNQPADHPVRLWTSLMEEEPRPCGSVLWRQHDLLAVVHQLDRDPSLDAHAIETCWRDAFAMAYQRGYEKLRAQLLGTIHAAMEVEEALAYLYQALERSEQRPKGLWLSSPRHHDRLALALQAFNPKRH